ncbi:hypothetical protein OG218_02940 [Kineococcus sp. NBC_00420]|uniref:DedA family protein n=1 Tax=Kineococcus sp. NBC_00420 TaxID=2903564 RepID=UPI002E22A875
MLREVGVGFLTLVETLIPPAPSEVVLPLAGFPAQQGRLSLPLVLVTATTGSVVSGIATTVSNVVVVVGRRDLRRRALQHSR